MTPHNYCWGSTTEINDLQYYPVSIQFEDGDTSIYVRYKQEKYTDEIVAAIREYRAIKRALHDKDAEIRRLQRILDNVASVANLGVSKGDVR